MAHQDTRFDCLILLFLLSTVTSVTQADEDVECVYTVYVRTGSIIRGGTDSLINLRLYDNYGHMAEIDNLVKWGGLMGPFHKYFERNNLDIFSGRGTCLPGSVCALNVTSDGSGHHHGWYCNYVEVTTVGGRKKECSQKHFEIEQWLARDVSPYELTAVRNYCLSYKDHYPHRIGARYERLAGRNRRAKIIAGGNLRTNISH